MDPKHWNKGTVNVISSDPTMLELHTRSQRYPSQRDRFRHLSILKRVKGLEGLEGLKGLKGLKVLKGLKG